MTTPSYSELVTAVRREGEGLLTAASLGCDEDVPTCEGWQLTDLVTHVGRVYLRIAGILDGRIAEPFDVWPEFPEGDPIDGFRDALEEMVTALKEANAETPVWNWSAAQPHTATFWARRMAHESSVHRFDAQAAHGVMQPIDAELAGDGIDELVDVIAARVYSRDDVSGPTGTVVLDSSDGDTWYLELTPHGMRRIDPPHEPDVTVSGTTSALLLACYSRIPWTSLATTGDADLLTRWSAAMSF